MRIYISGPMTGLPDLNRLAFLAAEAQWAARGWDVVNPTKNDGGSTDKGREFYMRLDYQHLLDVDAIALLPGWETSLGALAELNCAREIGLEIFDAITALPVEHRVVLTPFPDGTGPWSAFARTHWEPELQEGT